MASLTILLTLSAAQADAVKFCFLFCAVETAQAVDGFCASYERVNRSGADSVEIKKVPRQLKERIDRNDALYLCTCKSWDHPICKDLAK